MNIFGNIKKIILSNTKDFRYVAIVEIYRG